MSYLRLNPAFLLREFSNRSSVLPITRKPAVQTKKHRNAIPYTISTLRNLQKKSFRRLAEFHFPTPIY